MEEKQHAPLSFAQSVLPWLVAGGALLVYLLTLNHWVTLNSLPWIAKVTGWDWSLPLQAPLYFALTYPVRWLPGGWQPMALNAFSALCAALTLALLARAVALLPHDRTLAQRQRERSEFSLLSIPTAWLPPLFAVLVCGLQLTFWEHAVAGTNEALDLLLFAYVIRCLLEFRISQKESWLSRMALVYGLAAANNWAMVGFFPCFLVALMWIRGLEFFQFAFILRMMVCGVLGLLLYLLLPLVWTWSDLTSVSFWQALHAELANQKGYLLDIPALRNRVMILSLTSLLPVFILGIRWPSSFGDTSAAGAALTNLMFRIIHLAFLVACLWVFFDQRFSPRALVTSNFGNQLSFLTFYYLGALSVGYFTGYALLVFGEARVKSKSWRRQSEAEVLIGRVMIGVVWLAFLAVPAGLIYKNLPWVRLNNGAALRDIAEQLAKPLPPEGAVVLSDDMRALLLVEAHLSANASASKQILIHSRSLPVPDYHLQLIKRYPGRWPNVVSGIPEGEVVDDSALLGMMMELGRATPIYYLHPSFGFYFEHFYAEPRGLVYHLTPYATNQVFPPALAPAQFDANQSFWKSQQGRLSSLPSSGKREVLEGLSDRAFVGQYYSRALNDWAVTLQKSQRLTEAGEWFKTATELNTNNRPAFVNFEFNQNLQTKTPRQYETLKTIEEKFGLFRSWEDILQKNGPFDHPDFCLLLGDIFGQQNLLREAAIQFDRVQSFEPTNLVARLALANVYLQALQPENALATIAGIRALKLVEPMPADTELEVVRLEAAAHFARTNYAAAEKALLEAQAKYPDRISVLDALVMFYGKTQRLTNAFETIDKILKLSPDNPQALINQATLDFNRTNFPQAIRTLDRVLQKDPKNIPALLYRVFMNSETRDYTKAMEDVDLVLDLEPDHPEGLLYKGAIAIETKSYDQAVTALNRLLKQQPNNWKALRNRAIANLQRGKLSEAKEDYERLRRQLPRYYIAYYGLGEIAYRTKDTANAILFYELYLKHVPNVDTPEMAEERKTVTERLQALKNARR